MALEKQWQMAHVPASVIRAGEPNEVPGSWPHLGSGWSNGSFKKWILFLPHTLYNSDFQIANLLGDQRCGIVGWAIICFASNLLRFFVCLFVCPGCSICSPTLCLWSRKTKEDGLGSWAPKLKWGTWRKFLAPGSRRASLQLLQSFFSPSLYVSLSFKSKKNKTNT